jgi:hypothetical protein
VLPDAHLAVVGKADEETLFLLVAGEPRDELVADTAAIAS